MTTNWRKVVFHTRGQPIGEMLKCQEAGNKQEMLTLENRVPPAIQSHHLPRPPCLPTLKPETKNNSLSGGDRWLGVKFSEWEDNSNKLNGLNLSVSRRVAEDNPSADTPLSGSRKDLKALNE